jgi:hypothetical protein
MMPFFKRYSYPYPFFLVERVRVRYRFAKAQSHIRKRNDLISVYIDVKSVYELITTSEAPISDIPPSKYLLKLINHTCSEKTSGVVLSELIKEVNRVCESLSLWDRWTGKKWDYDQLLEKFSKIGEDVRTAKLRDEEILSFAV